MNKVSIGEYNTLVNKYNEVYKENKILKENAENNDKVVDKVNWENMLLKKQNKQLKIQIFLEKKEICFKLIEFYYTNYSIFNNLCISLNDLFEKYNKMLKKLESDSNE